MFGQSGAPTISGCEMHVATSHGLVHGRKGETFDLEVEPAWTVEADHAPITALPLPFFALFGSHLEHC